MSRRLFPCVLAAVPVALIPCLLAAQAPLQFRGTIPARPAEDTTTLRREHTFSVAAGQRIEVALNSNDFDTVLELHGPEGEELSNDDFGDSTNSRISTVATADGTWRASVGSFGGSSGQYNLEITFRERGVVRSLPDGVLSASDSVSAKGLRFTSRPITVAQAGKLTVEATSESFTPTLVLVSPTGRRFTNSTGNSTAVVEVAIAEAGNWRVLVGQSSEDDPTGRFSVRLIETPTPPGSRVESGSLEVGDSKDFMGEYYDSYTLTGVSGRRLLLDLISEEFDTFLAVRSPSGEWFRDDDGADLGTNSRLELDDAAGTWLVLVTSLGAEAIGKYELRIAH